MHDPARVLACLRAGRRRRERRGAHAQTHSPGLGVRERHAAAARTPRGPATPEPATSALRAETPGERRPWAVGGGVRPLRGQSQRGPAAGAHGMGCLGNSKTAEDQGVDEKERREANKKIEKQLQKERLAYKATHRLLLLGAGESGKSTIVKQMRILHVNGFNPEEHNSYLYPLFFSFISFQTIVSAMSTIIPPVPLANPENQFRSDYIKSIAPITDFEYSQPKFRIFSESSEKIHKNSCAQTEGSVTPFDVVKFPGQKTKKLVISKTIRTKDCGAENPALLQRWLPPEPEDVRSNTRKCGKRSRGWVQLQYQFPMNGTGDWMAGTIWTPPTDLNSERAGREESRSAKVLISTARVLAMVPHKEAQGCLAQAVSTLLNRDSVAHVHGRGPGCLGEIILYQPQHQWYQQMQAQAESCLRSVIHHASPRPPG
ncbi:Guanine nucleotide-binding protein G(olf) subunit alpha [Galemys pyrenaicus]|uniref:Guanine nucleotide-binding protein G(Olf) subunit alpha n=1 Tax=Galemys pyrenaicus TaxID=202257 RepID=A0A8J6A4K6_GALPY|nr:Guanine nucleotide-binding protein G(olf) subunit alpha [Galemys pyrenaicus]